MQIKDVPPQVFQSGPKRLKIPRLHYYTWSKADMMVGGFWPAPDPVPIEETELILMARTDPNGVPCFAAYDEPSDTLYVCYP